MAGFRLPKVIGSLSIPFATLAILYVVLEMLSVMDERSGRVA